MRRESRSRRWSGRAKGGSSTAPIRHRAGAVLVAGVGNVFLGDDGFGVEVIRRLQGRRLPDGVTARDYGIRGFDLAYALQYFDALVLVDTVPADEGPGTLHLLDASKIEPGPARAETHGMDPARVLAFARAVGPVPEQVYVIGCEPAVLVDPMADDVSVGLSPAVLRAVDGAVEMVESVVARLRATPGVQLQSQEATS